MVNGGHLQGMMEWIQEDAECTPGVVDLTFVERR
jgi:hypothetical protein